MDATTSCISENQHVEHRLGAVLAHLASWATQNMDGGGVLRLLCPRPEGWGLT